MASPISAAVSTRVFFAGPSSPPGRFYRPELDTLRFLAFFLVFLHHTLPHSSAEFPALARPLAAALASLARAGAWGVDLFFALSSYLITSLLVRELHARGSVDVRAFYVRRALRIWPLYFAALLVLAPALAAAIPGESLPLSYVSAYFFLAGNWACALWGFPASSFASLWSVSIEEQFYLVFPWLVRKNARYLPHLAVGALVVANATRLILVLSGSPHPGIWCNTLTRLDPIALGVLLASIPRGNPARRARLLLMVGALLAFVILGVWGDHTGTRALFTYPLAAAASVAVVAASLRATDSPACGQPLFSYLGKISYGLYVFHAAAIRLVETVGARQPLLLPVSLLVTVAVAGISYRYLESPFLRLKERFARVQSRPV